MKYLVTITLLTSLLFSAQTTQKMFVEDNLRKHLVYKACTDLKDNQLVSLSQYVSSKNLEFANSITADIVCVDNNTKIRTFVADGGIYWQRDINSFRGTSIASYSTNYYNHSKHILYDNDGIYFKNQDN